MEEYLKTSLGYSYVRRSDKSGGGCISQGSMFFTDQGNIFVKENEKAGAEIMFRGEFAGLEALTNTDIIKVPRPIKVLDRPTGELN